MLGYCHEGNSFLLFLAMLGDDAASRSPCLSRRTVDSGSFVAVGAGVVVAVIVVGIPSTELPHGSG